MKYYTAHCRDESSEDSLLLEQVRIQKEQIVFAVVCDGIGGLQQGEIASGLLAERLKRWFFSEGIEIYRNFPGVWGRNRAWVKSLNGKFQQISRELTEYGKENRCRLGTTCCGVLLTGRIYLLFSIGDSGAVKCSHRKSTLLNKPDINEKGQLLRCIGSEGRFPVRFYAGFLNKKELLLLGTDGFLRFLRREDMEGLNSRRQNSVSEWLELMRGRLRSRGEWDDMTAILIGRGR